MPLRAVYRARRESSTWTLSVSLAVLICGWHPALAIEVAPTPAQVAAAVQRGKDSAERREPPDRLYAWFGPDEELASRGFILTKLVGVTVMASHFALRGETPADSDLRQILDGTSFLVTVMILGDRPNFAVNSYVVMDQAGTTVKPISVRFDGSASRTTVWPKAPAYRAKVVASFNYADLDPRAKTTLSVFPPGGGEVNFELDFSTIQ
ncbi:hypothetical protein YTPLAS18_16330 [Nitrospira sp.]|nr:hypothetical protein YTPLAS18_16330 [Nitrospira sp.]